MFERVTKKWILAASVFVGLKAEEIVPTGSTGDLAPFVPPAAERDAADVQTAVSCDTGTYFRFEQSLGIFCFSQEAKWGKGGRIPNPAIVRDLIHARSNNCDMLPVEAPKNATTREVYSLQNPDSACWTGVPPNNSYGTFNLVTPIEGEEIDYFLMMANLSCVSDRVNKIGRNVCTKIYEVEQEELNQLILFGAVLLFAGIYKRKDICAFFKECCASNERQERLLQVNNHPESYASVRNEGEELSRPSFVRSGMR